MGILSGNPTDEPMHYGEVFGTWSFVSTSKALVSGYQTFLNHVGDKDLHKLVQQSIEQCQEEIKAIEKLLKENGIGLPPTPPERPEACLDDIPVGARVQDPEVAASVSRDIAAGLVACSQLIGQCVREDIAAMFSQFHMEKVALGGKFLKLSKEKGWLIPPPLHKSKNTDC
ncbi:MULTISPECIES: DUF3231 family protein [Priestia]|uniref:DUF3231 family protein n=1 Tax=Priestia TaxID=2800373 RepID=UPI00119D9840|nr:DUF3231 family protein [Priestia flexa]WHX77999.1 DUF3231 family protein [Priestia flexa]